MSGHPLLLSHRTQMGTCPENTLAGIHAAIAAGVDGIEVDVRAARDGTPMLLHDAVLSRSTGDPRLLAEVTPAAARYLRVRQPDGSAGDEGVPTLAAALEAVAGQCLLVLEVKEPGVAAAIARRVRAARAAEWCWTWSFLPDVVEEMRGALPEVPAALLVASPTPVDRAIATAVRLGAVGVSINHALIDDSVAESAARRGLALFTWTVNSAAEARRMRALGVSALCSDFPDRVERAYRRPLR